MAEIPFLSVLILLTQCHKGHVMRKPTFWFQTWSDTNHAVRLQKMARGLKFRIYKVEGLYYLSSKNKGADQLRSYREADLRLCFRICKTLVFFHDAAYNSLSVFTQDNSHLRHPFTQKSRNLCTMSLSVKHFCK